MFAAVPFFPVTPFGPDGPAAGAVLAGEVSRPRMAG